MYECMYMCMLFVHEMNLIFHLTHVVGQDVSLDLI